MARTSVKPERATVAHHGADVVTGVTALIRRGGDCFSWAIHFASRATPMARVVSQPKHQDPSVWFAHRCVWAIYQPGGIRRDIEAPAPSCWEGTYRGPLHFGPVRDIWDGHQPMSWQSPQAAGG